MLVAAAASFAAGLAGLSALPSTYTARALVGPAAGVYEGPADRLVEQALAPTSLGAIASACDVPHHRTLGEVLLGAPVDRVDRLAPRVDVRGAPMESAVVEASGATREAAMKAADLIAARLVECDVAHRRQAGGAAAVTSAGVAVAVATHHDDPAPVGPPARLLLEQLRLRHPLLRDPAPERRQQELAQRLSDDRIAIAALEAQLDGLTGEAERLERLVELESSHAWRLDLAERQAQAARLARPEPTREPRASSATGGASEPTSRLDELEAELAHLLASRTTLHPDVRRLVRLIESERQRVTSLSPPAGATTPPRAARPQHAAAPKDDRDGGPLLVPVADGPPDLQLPAPGGPEAWTQRVPSYGACNQARQRVEEAQLVLAARREEQAARQREHDLLVHQLAQLREPRLEEARLLERLIAEEQAARRTPIARDATPTTRPAPSPLVILQAAGIRAERSPMVHLPAWALASVILPLLGGLLLELRDRSVRGVEDVDGLGAPVLGVIPHLRTRGR